MNLLMTGLAIFFVIHFVPVFTGVRSAMVEVLGEGLYKGIFALISLTGFGLIVWGKAEAEFVHLWMPPQWGQQVTMAVVLLALVLIMASQLPGNLKRFTRHPMLWGVFVWALGHLLANGDLASVLLFGSFGIYSLIAMASANLRGASLAKAQYPLAKDLMVVVAGILLYAVLVYFHGFLFGIQVI